MRTVVQKWGNSLAIRIPKIMAAEIDVEQGASVDLSIDADGKMIVIPPRKRIILKALLAKMKPSNRHAEVDWGKPQGKEIW